MLLRNIVKKCRHPQIFYSYMFFISCRSVVKSQSSSNISLFSKCLAMLLRSFGSTHYFYPSFQMLKILYTYFSFHFCLFFLFFYFPCMTFPSYCMERRFMCFELVRSHWFPAHVTFNFFVPSHNYITKYLKYVTRK